MALNLSQYTPSQRALIGLAAMLTFTALALAIYGAVGLHTPVPWGDSWDGLIIFLMNVQDGQMSAWWGQHNEHRLLLSRPLYWLDYHIFGGRLISLFVWNFLFAACGVYLFIRLTRIAVDRAAPAAGTTANFVFVLTSLLLIAWLYLWTQYETLGYAFNPHFFLAYVLPLLAFYLMYKVHMGGGAKLFALACFVGVLAAGSMANAIATLPLMALYALIMGMSKKRIAILSGLAVIVITLYFSDYHSIKGHGSILESVLTHPIDVLHMTLNYMGGPFFFFAAGVPVGTYVAPLFGAFFIGSSAVFALKALKARKSSGFEIMLLIFILFIGSAAFASAGGRLFMGLNAAFAPRYTTSTVMAWAALLLLYMPVLFAVLKTKVGTRMAVGGFVLSLTLITLMNSTVFLEKRDWATGRAIGGLAAELQVHDTIYLSKIYPLRASRRVLKTSQKASARNLGFFGLPDYLDARETLGTAAPDAPQRCSAAGSAVVKLDGDENHVRVLGYIDPKSAKVGSAIYLVDRAGTIQGYGLTDMERALPDAPETVSRRYWFTAYLRVYAAAGPLYIQNRDGSCRTDFIDLPQ